MLTTEFRNNAVKFLEHAALKRTYALCISPFVINHLIFPPMCLLGLHENKSFSGVEFNFSVFFYVVLYRDGLVFSLYITRDISKYLTLCH